MSEYIQSGSNSPLVTLGSKVVTGWTVLLLSGEKQLSLATPPCLIFGTSDLLIDHSPEVKLYKHHL